MLSQYTSESQTILYCSSISRTLYSAFLGLHHENKKLLCDTDNRSDVQGWEGYYHCGQPWTRGEVGSENLHFQRTSFVNDPQATLINQTYE